MIPRSGKLDRDYPNLSFKLPGAEDGFNAVEVVDGVDADGVAVGLGYVDIDSIFKQAELFEALDLFEGRGGELREGGDGFRAIGVEAEVLAIGGEAGAVTVKGDGGAGEVEGAAVGGGDDLDGVGVGEVVGGAGDGDGGDLDFRAGEEGEHGCEVVGGEERLVALDVDVDVGFALAGDFVDAVGAAGAVGRGHGEGDAGGSAGLGDFVGVRGDEDFCHEAGADGGAVDPLDHGTAGDGEEDFTGEAGGAEAGGNDTEDALGAHRETV